MPLAPARQVMHHNLAADSIDQQVGQCSGKTLADSSSDS